MKVLRSKRDWKKIIGFFGIGFMLFFMLLIFVTVWYSFLWNDMVFSISINQFGEGLLEFLLLPLFFVLGVYGFYRYYIDMIRA